MLFIIGLISAILGWIVKFIIGVLIGHMMIYVMDLLSNMFNWIFRKRA